jgi:putative ABC transport system permease protein
MESLFHDARYAARKLLAAPAFTLAAIATLAIGIGATTAIFSTVNATLLRPLPFEHPDDLIALRTRLTDGRVTTGLLAPSEVARLNQSPHSIVRAVAFSSAPIALTLLRDNAPPVHADVYLVGEGFFDLFGLPMRLGSDFSHEQQLPVAPGQGQGPGPPPLVVLSHRVWTQMFGSDPRIVGKAVRFAEVNTTVAGVAPRELDLPHGADFWANGRFDSQDVSHGYDAIVRVKPGTTIERLRGEMAAAMTGLARDFPASDANREFVARPLAASIVGDLGPILLIVFAATTLLLLLACANVANLTLGRGAARAREIALRAAIGASRGRLVRQLLTESFLVTTVGALAGLALAFAGVRGLQALGASKLPRLESVPFDAHVLGFAALVLVVSGLLLGFAPAIRLAHTDLRTLVNESGRSTSGGRGTVRIMGAMTVAEVALAVTLVAGAGWLVQSFSKLRATDPGFVATGRLLADVRPDPQSVRNPDQALAWTQTLFERLRALPGVRSVASTAAFPLRGTLDASVLLQFRGVPFDPSRPPGARMRLVSPGFFEAMGIEQVSGRDFTADDRRNTMRVAIVNREFVRRYLSGKDPLRQQFAFGYPTIDTSSYLAIVGVVGDVRYKTIAEEAEPSFYVPQGQITFARQTVVIATGMADPAPMAATVRDEISRIDPQLAVDVETVPHLVASTLTRQQLGMTLMLLFGITALALAAVGIYGVIAYASAQRVDELATRLALGATRRQIFWLLMRRGQMLALAGVLIGLSAAYAGGRTVASLVYGIKATDLAVLGTATAVVVAITAVATALPARRAARTDPIVVLRGN